MKARQAINQAGLPSWVRITVPVDGWTDTLSTEIQVLPGATWGRLRSWSNLFRVLHLGDSVGAMDREATKKIWDNFRAASGWGSGQVVHARINWNAATFEWLDADHRPFDIRPLERDFLKGLL